jgi:hypothetical protein
MCAHPPGTLGVEREPKHVLSHPVNIALVHKESGFAFDHDIRDSACAAERNRKVA